MGSGEELIFINLSKPEDLKAADRRKLVRSQAAKDHSQSSSSIRKPVAFKPRRHRKILTAEYKLDLDGTKISETFTFRTEREFSTPTQTAPWRPGNSEQKLNGKQNSEKADSPAPLVLRSMSGAGWTAPFVPCPNQHFIPTILAHCQLNSCFQSKLSSFVNTLLCSVFRTLY